MGKWKIWNENCPLNRIANNITNYPYHLQRVLVTRYNDITSSLKTTKTTKEPKPHCLDLFFGTLLHPICNRQSLKSKKNAML